jgi:hypothetical protein
MKLDINKTIYVAVDAQNQEVTVLCPKSLSKAGFFVSELRIGNRDPYNTDTNEFNIIKNNMDLITFEI